MFSLPEVGLGSPGVFCGLFSVLPNPFLSLFAIMFTFFFFKEIGKKERKKKAGVLIELKDVG